MRQGKGRTLLMLPLLSLLCILPSTSAALAKGRPAAVAGAFYSADPAKLRAGIEAYLEDALPARSERPLALIAPHAGYIYSGQIAADAYGQAIGRDYDLIVILGTNHTAAGFKGVSVYDGSGYNTPLGLAPIDRQITQRLLTAEEVSFNPIVHAREHSIEAQVPFVQVAFPGVPIVAAVIGAPDLDLCQRFARTLIRAIDGRRPLIVASSDLSHYPTYGDAVKVDLETLAGVRTLDPASLQRTIAQQSKLGAPGLATRACGDAPMLTAMVAARALGAKSARILSYANSGDALIGDRSRVVGYGSVIFISDPPDTDGSSPWQTPNPAAPGKLTNEERRELLRFARDSIERYLETETTPLPRQTAGPLWQRQGLFVTLEKGGELRGCQGFVQTDLPMATLVGRSALQAAFKDPRFEPVTPAELGEIDISISLLGRLGKVASTSQIQMGVDGVLLVKNGRRALFLPEVAEQFGLSRPEFLDQLCLKAGLLGGCWEKGADLQTFRTESFSESELKAAGP